MLISVIVRSHNDAGVIRATLDMLSAQEGVEFELLNFDDNSVDATRRIVSEYSNVRRFVSDGGAYNPAKVLNRAVDEARGGIVVFNNSDAVPQSRDYLRNLVAPLQDPEVGAVFGNQLPRPDAILPVRRDYLTAFGDGSVSRHWPDFFSLVSSGARRELLLAERFDPAMQYSEDIEWSSRVRRGGKKIVYVPEARVEHSHNYSPSELKKRFYNEGFYQRMIFPDTPAQPWCRMAAGALAAWARDAVFALRNRHLAEWPGALGYRWRQRSSFARGVRDAINHRGEK